MSAFGFSPSITMSSPSLGPCFIYLVLHHPPFPRTSLLLSFLFHRFFFPPPVAHIYDLPSPYSRGPAGAVCCAIERFARLLLLSEDVAGKRELQLFLRPTPGQGTGKWTEGDVFRAATGPFRPVVNLPAVMSFFLSPGWGQTEQVHLKNILKEHDSSRTLQSVLSSPHLLSAVKCNSSHDAQGFVSNPRMPRAWQKRVFRLFYFEGGVGDMSASNNGRQRREGVTAN